MGASSVPRSQNRAQQVLISLVFGLFVYYQVRLMVHSTYHRHSALERRRQQATRMSLGGLGGGDSLGLEMQLRAGIYEPITPWRQAFPFNTSLFVPVNSQNGKYWEKAYRKFLHTCYNCSDATYRWWPTQRSNISASWVLTNPTDPREWARHNHFIFKAMMAQPRRNQWTTYLKSTQQLVNIGGRHGRTFETMNLHTGQRQRFDLLKEDLHHLDGGVVEAVEPGTGVGLGYMEIWVLCAFRGSIVDHEETVERTVVIDTRTNTLRWGPDMDIGRGACTGFTLQYKHYQLVCASGGSVGEHDRAIMVQHTSCYDRVRDVWIQLPREPVSLDHGNLHVQPAGVCTAVSPQRLLLFHGRHGPYGEPNRNLFALEVDETLLERWPVAKRANIADVLSLSRRVDDLYISGGWHKFMAVSKAHRRPPHAGASAMLGGRYIFGFGGDCYKLDDYVGDPSKAPKLVMDSIIIYDLCEKKYCVSKERMMKERFAAFGASLEGDYAAVCGGQADGRDSTWTEWTDIALPGGNVDRRQALERGLNYPACELFNMRTMVEECDVWEAGTLN